MRAAALLLPILIAGCTGSAAAPAGDKTAAVKPQAPAPTLTAVAQPETHRVAGVVQETIDAGSYTYVRLKTADGEVWAAVTQQVLKTGSEVSIGDAMWMENFESKTLKRKFDHVLFGTIVAPGAAAVALPPGHPPTAQGVQLPAAEDMGDARVEKASGKDAHTVAELFAAKASLKGTEVAIRGRVVKWNAEIMGKNWLHLRDGSGSFGAKDNDITVTTSDVVAKGDIVTVRGKVTLDKDFGAGYEYNVIIEDAKVIK